MNIQINMSTIFFDPANPAATLHEDEMNDVVEHMHGFKIGTKRITDTDTDTDVLTPQPNTETKPLDEN
jgi:hypothetical protein